MPNLAHPRPVPRLGAPMTHPVRIGPEDGYTPAELALLARHLEALAVEHDAHAARTDARVPPESKTMARAFARYLRRHAATLTGKATP